MYKILDYFPKAKFLQTYAKTSTYDLDKLKPITPIDITEYSSLCIYVLYQISDNFEYLLVFYGFSNSFIYFQDYGAVDLNKFYAPWRTLHKDYHTSDADDAISFFLRYLFTQGKLDKLKFFEEIKQNIEIYKGHSNEHNNRFADYTDKYFSYFPNLAQYIPNFLGLNWKKLPHHWDSWEAFFNKTDSLSIHMYSNPNIPVSFGFGTDKDFITYDAVFYSYDKGNIEEEVFVSSFNTWLNKMLLQLPFESLKRLISATYY